jgi:hypothetical protein
MRFGRSPPVQDPKVFCVGDNCMFEESEDQVSKVQKIDDGNQEIIKYEKVTTSTKDENSKDLSDLFGSNMDLLRPETDDYDKIK